MAAQLGNGRGQGLAAGIRGSGDLGTVDVEPEGSVVVADHHDVGPRAGGNNGPARGAAEAGAIVVAGLITKPVVVHGAHGH